MSNRQSDLDFFKKYEVTKSDGSRSVESRFDMGAVYLLGMILIVATLIVIALSVLAPLIILLWFYFYGYKSKFFKFASGTKMSIYHRYFVLLSAIVYVISAVLYFYFELLQGGNFVEHFFDKDLYTLVIPSTIISLIIVLIPLYKIKIVKIFTLSAMLLSVFIYVAYYVYFAFVPGYVDNKLYEKHDLLENLSYDNIRETLTRKNFKAVRDANYKKAYTILKECDNDIFIPWEKCAKIGPDTIEVLEAKRDIFGDKFMIVDHIPELLFTLKDLDKGYSKELAKFFTKYIDESTLESIEDLYADDMMYLMYDNNGQIKRTGGFEQTLKKYNQISALKAYRSLKKKYKNSQYDNGY